MATSPRGRFHGASERLSAGVVSPSGAPAASVDLNDGRSERGGRPTLAAFTAAAAARRRRRRRRCGRPPHRGSASAGCCDRPPARPLRPRRPLRVRCAEIYGAWGSKLRASRRTTAAAAATLGGSALSLASPSSSVRGAPRLAAVRLDARKRLSTRGAAMNGRAVPGPQFVDAVPDRTSPGSFAASAPESVSRAAGRERDAS